MRENVLADGAVIVGVRGLGHRRGLLGRVGNEGFLSRNDQVLPERVGQKIRPVGLQPVAVAPASLVLGPGLRNHDWVGHFFHDDGRVNHRVASGAQKWLTSNRGPHPKGRVRRRALVRLGSGPCSTGEEHSRI
jgi:hypothetical protein